MLIIGVIGVYLSFSGIFEYVPFSGIFEYVPFSGIFEYVPFSGIFEYVPFPEIFAHGGGKVVIYGDPRMPQEKKSQMLRALASALRYEEEYIFAPDMGTDELCMACIKDEIGRVVGLPCEVGGIPLDEVGATGWGLAQATEVALQYCDFKLKDARVVVQGFGAVGKHETRRSCRALRKKCKVLSWDYFLQARKTGCCRPGS